MAEIDKTKTDAVNIKPYPRIDNSKGLLFLYADFSSFIFSQQEVNSHYRFNYFPAILGRENTNDICIPHGSVSRQHAKFTFKDSAVFIEDLGSTNGIVLNGKYITKNQLNNGDIIKIGEILLKFIGREFDYYCGYNFDGTINKKQLKIVRNFRKESIILGGFLIDKIGAQIEKIASGDLSVLITGETGVGKELIARQLHNLSQRKGLFQAINCAAIPSELIESELFGYYRGAFTGAVSSKIGLIKSAEGGTLFLDEVGELPLILQAKLLRTLQFKEILPLGGSKAEKVNIRLICATNRDLEMKVKEESFRADLFARINEFHIQVPPLRDRKEDIYPFIKYFLQKLKCQKFFEISFSFMLALIHYNWPYNVRELESVIKRCVTLSCENPFNIENLPENIQNELKTYGIKETEKQNLDDINAHDNEEQDVPSKETLINILEQYQGNISAVARHFGKKRMQIHRWMQKYNIDPTKFRK